MMPHAGGWADADVLAAADRYQRPLFAVHGTARDLSDASGTVGGLPSRAGHRPRSLRRRGESLSCSGRRHRSATEAVVAVASDKRMPSTCSVAKAPACLSRTGRCFGYRLDPGRSRPFACAEFAAIRRARPVPAEAIGGTSNSSARRRPPGLPAAIHPGPCIRGSPPRRTSSSDPPAGAPRERSGRRRPSRLPLANRPGAGPATRERAPRRADRGTSRSDGSSTPGRTSAGAALGPGLANIGDTIAPPVDRGRSDQVRAVSLADESRSTVAGSEGSDSIDHRSCLVTRRHDRRRGRVSARGNAPRVRLPQRRIRPRPPTDGARSHAQSDHRPRPTLGARLRRPAMRSSSLDRDGPDPGVTPPRRQRRRGRPDRHPRRDRRLGYEGTQLDDGLPEDTGLRSLLRVATSAGRGLRRPAGQPGRPRQGPLAIGRDGCGCSSLARRHPVRRPR